MYNHENIMTVNSLYSIHQGLKRHNCAVFCKLRPHAVDITIYSITLCLIFHQSCDSTFSGFTVNV